MPRIAHPAFAVPGAMDSLVALSKASKAVPGLPLALLELMHLRASQINGDGNNVNLHPRLARAAGETSEDRIMSIASWRNTPWFSGTKPAATMTSRCSPPWCCRSGWSICGTGCTSPPGRCSIRPDKRMAG